MLFGIPWRPLVFSAGILALTAITHLLLRWFSRRFRAGISPAESPLEPRRWLVMAVEAAVLPVAVLIWVYGSYTALTILVASSRFQQTAAPVLAAADWLKDLSLIVTLILFLSRMTRIAEAYLKELASRTRGKWDNLLAALAGKALRLILPLLGLILAVPILEISPTSNQFFKQALSLALIGTIAFILFELLATLEEAVLDQYRIDVRDNLEARKIYTQVKVLKKVAVAVIAVFALASMLMVFDSVRRLGTSILASAGIAGIIVGFAAQRSIATLLAGLQIAITQPIRLDDVVIVEGEWGRIEEIALSYVVVRIWDLRRLVVPINYFIEKPFQNWTRVSADLLGSVFLYVDYTLPLKALREEFDRIVEHSKLWDRKVKVLQVTDAKESALELRALVSAADSSAAWDLRCEVREKLVEFIQKNYPQCLPRFRAELPPFCVPQAAEISRQGAGR